MLVLKGDRHWEAREIKGDLEVAWTPPYSNVQPADPQVSLVKLPKHASVLSAPSHLLHSRPSSELILS